MKCKKCDRPINHWSLEYDENVRESGKCQRCVYNEGRSLQKR